MKNISTFGIWGNTDKKSFWRVFPDILIWSRTKNLTPLVTKRIFKHPNFNNKNLDVINSVDEINDLDFILVLGGDGTFLSLARNMKNCKTPILGVHLGDLGFLAKVTLSDLFHRLDQVAKGDFILEDRILIQSILEKTDIDLKYYALNDFVLSNADVDTQWMGWAIACISCSMWIRFAIKDKDIPRALMELMYLCLAIRGIFNWLQ